VLDPAIDHQRRDDRRAGMERAGRYGVAKRFVEPIDDGAIRPERRADIFS